MNIVAIICVLVGHWVADYIFQTSDKTITKHGDVRRVADHAGQYSTVMTGIVALMIVSGIIVTTSWYFIINFYIFTFVFHFIVDYYTSKLTKVFWEKTLKYEYFSSIITDQMLHLVTLFLTINYLFY